jgi:hypothetical protein
MTSTHNHKMTTGRRITAAVFTRRRGCANRHCRRRNRQRQPKHTDQPDRPRNAPKPTSPNPHPGGTRRRRKTRRLRAVPFPGQQVPDLPGEPGQCSGRDPGPVDPPRTILGMCATPGCSGGWVAGRSGWPAKTAPASASDFRQFQTPTLGCNLPSYLAVSATAVLGWNHERRDHSHVESLRRARGGVLGGSAGRRAPGRSRPQRRSPSDPGRRQRIAATRR